MGLAVVARPFLLSVTHLMGVVMGWGKGCLIGGAILAMGAGVVWLVKRESKKPAVMREVAKEAVRAEEAVKAEEAVGAEEPKAPAARPDMPWPRDEISEAVISHVADRLMREFNSQAYVLAHIQEFVDRLERGLVTEDEVAIFLERRPQGRCMIKPWLFPNEVLNDLHVRGHRDGEGELDMQAYGGYLIAEEEADEIRATLNPRDRYQFEYLYAALDEFLMTTDDETSDVAQQYCNLLMRVRNQTWKLNCYFTHDIDLHLFWHHGLQRLRQILRFSSFSTNLMSAEDLEFRVRAWIDLIATQPEHASRDLLKFKGLPNGRKMREEPLWTSEMHRLTPIEVAEMYHGKKVTYACAGFRNAAFERGEG